MGTKETILIAAKKRFLDRGFHGTSMRDITNTCGVSQGGIYSCFISKEDLFKEVLNQAIPFDVFFEELSLMLKEESEPEILFKKLSITFLSAFDIDTMKLRMIDFLEFKGNYFQLLLTERIKNNSTTLLDKIQSFIDEGKIKKTNPKSLLLSFFMSVFSYLFIKSYILGKQPLEEELIETINIFLYGSLPPKEKINE
ncbi:MAG: TetR/AcrR family transcriptional regulator [Candidatus Margulisbacteria bacterium]|nr:TetR/AcrR family transcriptional regulator [Candidatus Margulisiibacteriota bacterium]